MKQYVLLVAGFAALALGGIGIFIPVFPTTPFVLAAAGCFGASSPRLYSKLEQSRFFGEFVRNYRDKTGVSLQNKAVALTFLWGMLLLSCLIVGKALIISILLFIGACVTVHLVLLRTKR